MKSERQLGFGSSGIGEGPILTVEIERLLLIILYSTAPPKQLTEDSLVHRVRAIYPSITDIETEVRNALNKLREGALCVELPDNAGKLSWSLSEKGLEILDLGEWSPGSQVETETPKDRVSIGIPGLDELLAGGIPSGNVILLRGPPGVGKTILAAQFLFAGMTKLSENGVYVSFDVAKGPFLRQMKGVGMHFKEFEGKRFAFLDAAPIRLLSLSSEIDNDQSGGAKLAALNLVDDIRSKTEEIDAVRLVIDPFTSLTMLYDDSLLRRLGTLMFFESLSKMGITTIITAEASRLGEPRSLTHEEYLSDGVISLQTLKAGNAMIRAVEVEKMRETEIDRQPRPYRITGKGIEVYPRESVV